MTNRTTAAMACVLVFAAAGSAWAQGLIIDQRPDVPPVGAYEVTEVAIDAQVRDQVAEVQVTQVFHNPTRRQMEVEYWFPLPDDGAVQNMVLLVDGKEMPGRILPRDEARRIYEDIVRKRKDPALLEYMGRGLFRTSVFPVPAGGDRKVTLRYTQLCQRDHELVTFSYPLSTQKHCAKPIGKLTVDARIRTADPIKSVYSPTHAVKVKHIGEHEATMSMELRDIMQSHDFQAIYSHAKGSLGASVLSYRPRESEDGYFLMLASPGFTEPDRKPIAKSVIFVIDKSGSMQGKKIEQAREAARFIVNNLNDSDTFNIIAYDDRVDSFAPELQRYSGESRAKALSYIDNLRAGGSTNINAALTQAMGMLTDKSRPCYILFLTDGLPTAGEQTEAKIAENCKKANDVRARVIAFGVGYDVNARLLDRVSHSNGGSTEYVKPDDSVEAAVSRFYAKLTAPVLTGIEIAFAGTDVNRTYPRDLPDLFDGGQLVWVGRYRRSGDAKVTITGNVGDRQSKLTIDARLADRSSDETYAFVERLWAVRRVGYLIDEIDLRGRNEELIKELVDLSSRYGILTPYTSFLADENVAMGTARDNLRRAGTETEALSTVSGRSGNYQRAAKSAYMESDQAAASTQPVASDAAGNVREVTTVKQIGNKTFYRKGDRWIDASVTDELDKRAIVIKQYSDEYFELVRQQSAADNTYFTIDDNVTVNVRGQVYSVRR